MTHDEPIKTIEGRARTVREVLDKAKYAIDSYQREYAWQERQVRELVEDLTLKFRDHHEPDHERHQVEHYSHYFLGSIVLSHKRGQRFIVDGQQRLTTLTLLLVYLHHLQADRKDAIDVSNLIYSEKYGRKSFNLDVDDREPILQALLDGTPIDTSEAIESVRNIEAQYRNLAGIFPEELTGDALPFFLDWFLENVHLVVIEAYSDEDAYTIFETMNDRGLSLSLPEMLKGYVLSKIRREDDLHKVNRVWRQRMQQLKGLGDQQDVDFFKDWLRARHAVSIRPGRKGAENKDFERIGREFHRWVREKPELLGIVAEDDFKRFVCRDLDFYARHYLDILRAASRLTESWESIRYNEDRAFTLQTQVLLAPLTPHDDAKTVHRKVALVADYLDIWLARRAWNFRTNTYSSMRYTVFQLTKELRNRDVEDLSIYLRGQLDEQTEGFATEPGFSLHKQNYRQIRHILARLTHWVDDQCGLACHFEDLISQGRARQFEIEHIWADHYGRFRQWFDHPSEFASARNRIGGLLLLQSGLNQSLGAATYEEKRDAYLANSCNLLARSLHPLAYQNNPTFRALRDETGLPFRSLEQFGPEEQKERQELYLRIAECVWNPSRLDLDGLKPAVHDSITNSEENSDSYANRPEYLTARRAFWTRLLSIAQQRSDLHGRISAGRRHWISARRHGVEWVFAALQQETRVELYIDGPDAAENKRFYDALHSQKEAVEQTFGGPLSWQRLDEKRACRISHGIEGGWVDESIWPRVIEQTVDAMGRLYAALAPPIEALREEAP